MAFRFVALLACVGAAVCEEYKPAYGKYPANYDTPAKYSFDYAVKDDPSYNDFGHQEARDGDKTSGSYRVLLPDGRVQTVTYSVDGYSGYNADVQYSGEAKYDYKPAYKAPAYPAPAYTTPAYPKPAYSAPAYTTPVYPAYKPSYPTPAYPSYKPSYPTPAYPSYKPSYPAPAYPAYQAAYKPSYPAPAYPAYKPAYPAPAYPAYRPAYPEYQRYPVTTVAPVVTEVKAEEAPVTEAVVVAQEETTEVAQV